MTRRKFLLSGVASGVLAALAMGRPARAADEFPLTHTDAEWRKLLGERYGVLRMADTEEPFSSDLLDEHRRGDFLCAGCAQNLFSSATKYESGTGWPSFWDAVDKAVVTRDDHLLFVVRTELLCSNCGGHLGHRFTDGPKPTGLRYCINGLALTFRQAKA